MSLRETITTLLNNQPNGVRIGCGRYRVQDPLNTPFHHLSRIQQIEQITEMLACGVDLIELQRELYLVCHKLTCLVWLDFGLPIAGLESDSDTLTDEDYLEE